MALLFVAGCGGPILPGDRSGPVEASSIPLILVVEVEDSLDLPCTGAGTSISTAHHWITADSQLRLTPDGTAVLSVEADDRPPSRVGEPRCRTEGHRHRLRRVGSYAVDDGDVVAFSWDPVEVPGPDDEGWYRTETLRLGDGIPTSDRTLLSRLELLGREAITILRFTVVPSGG